MSSPLRTTLFVLVGVASVLAQKAVPAAAPNVTLNNTVILDQPRAAGTNVLANLTAMYPFPNSTAGVPFNVTNIQGDILVGMKKKLELFYFFKINNDRAFKNKLRNNVVPRITSTFDMLNYTTQPQVMLNIAFSRTGLNVLGQTTSFQDPSFDGGMLADVGDLGDANVTANWVSAFQGTNVHGVLLMASDTQTNIDAQKSYLEQLFSSDITKLYTLQGNIRPAPYEGHEMFGFMDGIAQPAVIGFNTPQPGQETIDPGVILQGESGDAGLSTRQSWQQDGSFLVFRQLKQLVPEFNKFMKDNAPVVPGLTRQEQVDLFGARMVGRWKSGAPVDLSPLKDNLTLALSPANNNFNYFHTGFDIKTDQSHCPFAAHIRKTRPRGDFDDLGISAKSNSILRSGIPYGPEVTTSENNSNLSSTSTTLERGLAFVSYQSVIENGFKFLQQTWANNPNFVFAKNETLPGFDPIIGQNHGASRFMNGYDPLHADANLALNKEFVISRGGEYFFSPSISALAGILSA